MNVDEQGRALLKLAAQKQARGDDAGALADCSEVLNLVGLKAEIEIQGLARCLRGAIYCEVGRYSDAIAECATGLTVQGVPLTMRQHAAQAWARAHLELNLGAAAKGDHRKAIDLASAVINAKIVSELGILWDMWGLALVARAESKAKLGDVASASNDLCRALQSSAKIGNKTLLKSCAE